MELNIIDLFDSLALEHGFGMMSSDMDNNKLVFVIICGGDGTISWVINDLSLRNIKMSSLIFGILPIGTGNDLCRSLGWESESFTITVDNFSAQINRWRSAQIEPNDIW